MARESTSLAQQILDDVALMARYAASTGKRPPRKTAELLARVGADADTYIRGDGAKGAGAGEAAGQRSAADRLRDIEELGSLHAQLSRAVAPATPRSLRETEDADGLLAMLVNVRLVRYMAIVGLLSLVGFGLLLCVTTPENKLLFQLMLLSAAALGASFHALYTSQKYVTDKTFDSRFVPTYFVRFILGLIAGPILANIAMEMGWVGTGAEGGTVEALKNLGPNTISLLGGYSAEAVNQILNRLMQVVVSIVKGDEREAARSREEALRTELTARMQVERQGLAKLVSDARLEAQDEKTRAALDAALERLNSET